MSRQGASRGELASLLARFTDTSTIALEAVMTHLYGSDEANREADSAQLARLDDLLTEMDSLFPPRTGGQVWLSVGASAALLSGSVGRLNELAGRHDLIVMLRLGLALYGVVPRFDPDFAPREVPAQLASARQQLQSVLSWKSGIASVRQVPARAEVGYNGTFVATEPMRLALIAAGYADGLDRSLGNRFSLLVRGQRAPLVGRVSMDQAVVDVTEIPDAAPEDEVVIIGRQGGEEITAYDHAEAAGTIPWEVFTRIGARVTRGITRLGTAGK
jgi:alanine racemase